MRLSDLPLWATWAITSFVTLIVTAILAFTKTGRSLIGRCPDDTLDLTIHLTRDETVRVITEATPGSGYRVDVVSRNGDCVVLADGPNFFSWGFFYPIYLAPVGDGDTRIRIGIKSRLFQDRLTNPIRASRRERVHRWILDVFSTQAAV